MLRTDILTLLSLPVYQHGLSLHLFIYFFFIVFHQFRISPPIHTDFVNIYVDLNLILKRIYRIEYTIEQGKGDQKLQWMGKESFLVLFIYLAVSDL